LSSVIPLKPGSGYKASCPENSVHTLNQTQFYPEGTNEVLLSPVDAQSVYIAPLRFGQWEFKIPCQPTGNIQLTISIEPGDGKNLPKPDAPLGLINPGFPISLIVLWIFLILILSGLIYFLLRKFFPTSNDTQNSSETEIDFHRPYKDWQKLLANYKSLSQKDESTALARTNATSPMALALRSYLEYKLDFSASWASTPEFMGSLKAASLSLEVPEEFYQKIERLLYSLDTIRFAKKEVSFMELKTLYSDFETLTESAEKLFKSRAGAAV
jgi:hypothetical protein